MYAVSVAAAAVAVVEAVSPFENTPGEKLLGLRRRRRHGDTAAADPDESGYRFYDFLLVPRAT